MKEAIWSLIERLAHDSTESNILHEGSHEDPRTYDYLTLGINSPRGKAIGAALNVLDWEKCEPRE